MIQEILKPVKHFLIAQATTNQATTQSPSSSGGFVIDSNSLGALGGLGVLVFAGVQIWLKVYEKKATTQIASDSAKTQAEIQQDGQALATLVEVFRKGQEANYELQAKSFESTSQLMAQMMAIKSQSTEQLVENLLARMDAYDRNQLAINEAFRHTNAAIADLAELIKKIDWRGDTSTQEMRQYFQEFSETVKRIHMRIDNATGHTN